MLDPLNTLLDRCLGTWALGYPQDLIEEIGEQNFVVYRPNPADGEIYAVYAKNDIAMSLFALRYNAAEYGFLSR